MVFDNKCGFVHTNRLDRIHGYDDCFDSLLFRYNRSGIFWLSKNTARKSFRMFFCHCKFMFFFLFRKYVHFVCKYEKQLSIKSQLYRTLSHLQPATSSNHLSEANMESKHNTKCQNVSVYRLTFLRNILFDKIGYGQSSSHIIVYSYSCALFTANKVVVF